MRIISVSFETPDPARAEAFYGETLGLPTRAEDGVLLVRAGRSELRLRRGEPRPGRHHLAFTIPRRAFPAAMAWLADRVEFIRGSRGEDEFEFSGLWNARSAYFADPDGNVLEFIIRRDLPDDDADDFDPERIVCISEVGVALPDVPGFAAAAGDALGLPSYGGGDDAFRPLGDIDGLLIAVAPGRHWFPTTAPSGALPLAVELESDRSGWLEPVPGVVVRSRSRA